MNDSGLVFLASEYISPQNVMGLRTTICTGATDLVLTTITLIDGREISDQRSIGEVYELLYSQKKARGKEDEKGDG